MIRLQSLTNGATLLVVLLAGLLVLGAALGQPIGLSFVESGSMEPAMKTNDGFVSVPRALAGDIDRGDVVVFDAEFLHDGGLVTHRVVDETPQGYITKGDANPFTDQAADEPPVSDSQILAVALQVNGDVVVVPHLGTATELLGTPVDAVLSVLVALGLPGGVQGLAYTLFAVSLLWYVAGELRARTAKSRVRDGGRHAGTNPQIWLLAMTLLLVVAATASMTAPGGVHQYKVVSGEMDAPGPRVIEMGETETTTYRVSNSGVIPVVVFVESTSSGLELDRQSLRLARGDSANVSVALTAPPTPGYYPLYLVEYRYLGVLPDPLLRSLYHVHPWLPVVAIDLCIGVPFFLVGRAVVGTNRFRERTRPVRPLSVRLRRLLR